MQTASSPSGAASTAAPQSAQTLLRVSTVATVVRLPLPARDNAILHRHRQRREEWSELPRGESLEILFAIAPHRYATSRPADQSAARSDRKERASPFRAEDNSSSCRKDPFSRQVRILRPADPASVGARPPPIHARKADS